MTVKHVNSVFLCIFEFLNKSMFLWEGLGCDCPKQCKGNDSSDLGVFIRKLKIKIRSIFLMEIDDFVRFVG